MPLCLSAFFYQGTAIPQNSSYTYTWDDLNRLVACDGLSLPHTTNGYGTDGLRAWSGSPYSPVKTFYVYDGGTLLGEVSTDLATAVTVFFGDDTAPIYATTSP